jgi:hypothetical protein
MGSHEHIRIARPVHREGSEPNRLAEAAVVLPLFLYAVYAIARGQLGSFLLLPLESITGGVPFSGRRSYGPVSVICHSLPHNIKQT